jgi:quercetin dioxygenase-like cupin family protein
MPASPPCYSWARESFGRTKCFNIVRHRHPQGEGFPAHSHDYVEFFWIEAGSYRHERNGRVEVMEKGDIAFLQPDDIHHGHAIARNGGVLVNVAFPSAAVIGLADSLAEAWPWTWPADRKLRLSRQQLARMQTWLQALRPPHNRTADLIAMLADVARLLTPATKVADGWPLWLNAAVAAFVACDPLPTGVDAFVTAGGRSLAHTSR